MRKFAALVLVLACALSLAGCGKEHAKDLPVPEYPISQELVARAMEKAGLPDNLRIEENDILEYEGVSSTSYTLRHPTKDLYAGACMGILSHRAEAFSSLGITVSTIDQTEEITEEEIRQTIAFAVYLFWQDEKDSRILDGFMKEYVEGESLKWEKKIDGVDCRIIYNPQQRQPKFQIAFSTDMETQLASKFEPKE